MTVAINNTKTYFWYPNLVNQRIMSLTNFQYLTDASGKKTSVLIPIEIFNDLMEQLEELEDIKAYDLVKEQQEEIIPFEQAIEEIEQAWKMVTTKYSFATNIFHSKPPRNS